jgi:hypothetical protein
MLPAVAVPIIICTIIPMPLLLLLLSHRVPQLLLVVEDDLVPP